MAKLANASNYGSGEDGAPWHLASCDIGRYDLFTGTRSHLLETTRHHTRDQSGLSALNHPQSECTSAANTLTYIGCALRWPVERIRRSLRVYVVEPIDFSLHANALLFAGILGSFIAPRVVDVGGSERPQTTALEPFDLLTFPEAFVTPETLLDALRSLKKGDLIGCVHVGLHSAAVESHLFSVDEIRSLLNDIRKLPDVEHDDLSKFEQWFDAQQSYDRFNIGCLFTVDAKRRVRVCLHPKMVASQYEVSALVDNHMKEGNLLSVVTLEPVGSKTSRISIQPLLCSDALQLQTEVPSRWPLQGLNLESECLGPDAPDHIDIVSLPTYTPQQPLSRHGAGRQWHQKYRTAFVQTSETLMKHRTAIFIMSNYSRFPGGRLGGLSGAYVPWPLGSSAPFPDFVAALSYREDADKQMLWLPIPEDEKSSERPRNDCYIAALSPDGHDASSPAQALGFTINRMIQDHLVLSTHSVLCKVELYRSDEGGNLSQGRASK